VHHERRCVDGGQHVADVDRGRWRGMPFCVMPLVSGSARSTLD